MKKKAVILIGFQNDYFSENGLLRKAVEVDADRVLDNTLRLIKRFAENDEVMLISTPISFNSEYSEIKDPVGILGLIKEIGAFASNSEGVQVIESIKKSSAKIFEVTGKHGLNAFSGTNLDNILKELGVEEIAVIGVVTSLCIDSTARSAHERGYRVYFPKDCIGGRTREENDFYFDEVFPMYGHVVNSDSLWQK